MYSFLVQAELFVSKNLGYWKHKSSTFSAPSFAPQGTASSSEFTTLPDKEVTLFYYF